MSLEIEKKFIVGSFEETFEKLKNDFGKYIYNLKPGFWWCNNYTGLENMLNLEIPKLSKKEVSVIKDIANFILPDQNFQYIRLRIHNKKKYIVTFKIKLLVNKIEQNTEYEFEVDKAVFKRIALYLKNTSSVFYYNIKESWEFSYNDIKIEISKFNDLKDSYIEVETLGEHNKELFSKLDNIIKRLSDYNMKEETRNYSELSYVENRKILKNLKLSQYSRKGIKILEKYL